MKDLPPQVDAPQALTAYLEALFREPAAPPPEPAAPPAPRLGAAPLQALLVDVWGLVLALPVDGLDTIVKWPPRLARTPTRDTDRLGMMEHGGHSVPVFDLLRLLDAGERRAAGAERSAAASHVLVVGGARFGLACTGPRHVVELQPADIQPARVAERPWYAGTLREQLCPLVDLQPVLRALEARCRGA